MRTDCPAKRENHFVWYLNNPDHRTIYWKEFFRYKEEIPTSIVEDDEIIIPPVEQPVKMSIWIKIINFIKGLMGIDDDS